MVDDYKEALKDVLCSKEYKDLMVFLSKRYQEVPVYPVKSSIFDAMRKTPLSEVKVVILGQDPYHGPGQATGLAFGVKRGLPRPPSLRNIIKELQTDIGVEIPSDETTLEGWAAQGVLLLNTALTVEEGKAGSHMRDWSFFTDAVIKVVADRGAVFVLWGNNAKKKVIGYTNKVFEAAHPSPLSCSGFFGCKHFSKVNQYLKEKNKKPIDWTRIENG